MAEDRLGDWERDRQEAAELVELQDAVLEVALLQQERRGKLNERIRSSNLPPAEIARVLGWSRQRVNGVLHPA